MIDDESFLLQESIQQLTAGIVQRLDVADQGVDAITVGDQQGGVRNPADIVFSFENEGGVAAVGIDLP
jgi:hypothetical protein